MPYEASAYNETLYTVYDTDTTDLPRYSTRLVVKVCFWLHSSIDLDLFCSLHLALMMRAMHGEQFLIYSMRWCQCCRARPMIDESNAQNATNV